MSRPTADSRNYRWRRVSATEPPLSTPAKYPPPLDGDEGDEFSWKRNRGNCDFGKSYRMIASWRMCTRRGSLFFPKFSLIGRQLDSRRNCVTVIAFSPPRKRVNIVRSTHERNYFRAKYSRSDLGQVFHSSNTIYIETIRRILERYSTYSLQLFCLRLYDNSNTLRLIRDSLRIFWSTSKKKERKGKERETADECWKESVARPATGSQFPIPPVPGRSIKPFTTNYRLIMTRHVSIARIMSAR